MILKLNGTIVPMKDSNFLLFLGQVWEYCSFFPFILHGIFSRLPLAVIIICLCVQQASLVSN
jgi:hypothetical protein